MPNYDSSSVFPPSMDYDLNRPRSRRVLYERRPDEIISDSVTPVSESKKCERVEQAQLPETNAPNEYEDEFVSGFHSQRELFAEWAKPVIDNVAKGYNACYFAYGACDGDEVKNMFKNIFESLTNRKYKVFVRHFEIVHEKLYDLCDAHSKRRRPLQIREDPKIGPYAENLTYIEVQTCDELHEFFTCEATNARKKLRSHRVFTIYVEVYESEIITSKINLIDLANGKRSAFNNRADPSRIWINKSILTLGKVLTAVATCQTHVPFRESTLTWFMREHLQNAQITISPGSSALVETLSVLSSVRNIGVAYFLGMHYLHAMFPSVDTYFEEKEQEWEENFAEELCNIVGSLNEFQQKMLIIYEI